MHHLRRFCESFVAVVVALVAPEKNSLRAYGDMSATELRRVLRPAAALPASMADWLSAIFSYADPRVREIVWEIKYRRHNVLAEKMGRLLYEEMARRTKAAQLSVGENGEKIILAPISSSKERRRERGFNQCEVLCEAIMKCEAAAEIFEYVPDLLVKTKNTPHQADLQRADRLQNIVGSYKVAAPEKYREHIIYIVDDVVTTGATLSEARRVLVEAGAREVHGFAIAH